MDTEDLIRRHLPLVRAIARRYAGRGETVEDLRQCGAIGLVIAAQRWDPDRGISFGAYATPLVAGEIRRHLRDRAGLVRLPRRVWENAARCRSAARELNAALGRPATPREIATRAGLDPEEAIEALGASAWPLALEDLTDAAEPPSDPVDRGIRALALLQPGQRRFLELIAVQGRTQRQIAALYGVSQSQVSRAYAAVVRDLRRSLEDQECPERARVLAG